MTSPILMALAYHFGVKLGYPVRRQKQGLSTKVAQNIQLTKVDRLGLILPTDAAKNAIAVTVMAGYYLDRNSRPYIGGHSRKSMVIDRHVKWQHHQGKELETGQKQRQRIELKSGA